MTKQAITTLKEIYHQCTFTSFRSMDAEKDEMVREYTRLYRETWILPHLAKLIRKGEPTWNPPQPCEFVPTVCAKCSKAYFEDHACTKVDDRIAHRIASAQ